MILERKFYFVKVLIALFTNTRPKYWIILLGRRANGRAGAFFNELEV